jgi:hypothetical protein
MEKIREFKDFKEFKEFKNRLDDCLSGVVSIDELYNLLVEGWDNTYLTKKDIEKIDKDIGLKSDYYYYLKKNMKTRVNFLAKILDLPSINDILTTAYTDLKNTRMYIECITNKTRENGPNRRLRKSLHSLELDVDMYTDKINELI